MTNDEAHEAAARNWKALKLLNKIRALEEGGYNLYVDQIRTWSDVVWKKLAALQSATDRNGDVIRLEVVNLPSQKTIALVIDLARGVKRRKTD